MIKTAELKSATIEYLELGKGPVLLFLHGALASYRIYTPLAKMLSKYYHVYMPTFPGHGKSKVKQGSISLDYYTEVVKEFMNELKLKPAGIVGHSMGGAVAINLLAKNPKLTKKLVLIDSAGIPYKNFVWQTVRGWFAQYGEYSHSKLQKKGFDYILPWDTRHMLFRPLVGLKIGRLLTKLDLRKEMQKLDIPTLVIWGAEDSHFPLDNGKQINGLIRNSQLETVTPAEHNWLIYQSEICRNWIHTFI